MVVQREQGRVHPLGCSKRTREVMQAPLELVGLGSSSSMDSFASWKINGSGMEKEEIEETPLQGEDESRRSSPP